LPYFLRDVQTTETRSGRTFTLFAFKRVRNSYEKTSPAKPEGNAPER
jgi:hypothetical protein